VSEVIDALSGQRQLRVFLRGKKIAAMPSKRTRRLELLDCVAQAFEPGVRYPESSVNDILLELYDDPAELRRYLVDEGFMSRGAGVYWRTGGSVDITPGPPAGPDRG
jgi:hypothetical protein